MQDVLKARFGHMITEVDGCWLWRGGTCPNGMPRYRGGSVRRMFYRMIVGNIPDNRNLRVICGNRLCVNPDHVDYRE